MKIVRIKATEVIVPANPGAVNSPRKDTPLHKLESGAAPAWTKQFDAFPKCILELELEDGTTGLGETYRDPDPRVLEAIARRLIGVNIHELDRRKLPVARCREYDGFECAVWDAYAKLADVPLHGLLGGAGRSEVRVGAWSGHRMPDEIGELAARFAGQGFDSIKFKCDLEDDVAEWCSLIAEAAPGMSVILDPNERWRDRASALRRIRSLEPIGSVLCVEDPLPRWNLDDYALLRSGSAVPLALHVSLPYRTQGQRVADAVEALRRNAVDGFNFNGGIAEFQQLALLAEAAELPCWHGSEADLGILEALYLQKAAAAPACVWPSDVFGRLIRSHDLLARPLEIRPPFAHVPDDGPGLGVRLDPGALERFATGQRTFTADS